MSISKTSPRFTHAMVLAAGIGKRMRPISATTPKPLVEIAGKSLIDYGLDRLAAAGVETAVVNVHYLADLVEFHVCKRATPKVIVSDERAKLMDTGGGTRKALAHFGDKAFIAYNSDSAWIEGAKPNFDILSAAWDDDQMDLLLMLSPTVNAVGYDGPGDFSMDALGRLTRRAAPRIAPFVYAGAAIVHPRAFADTPEGPFSFNLLFDRASAKGRLFGVRMDGQWLHVGTPQAIRDAEAAIQASAA